MKLLKYITAGSLLLATNVVPCYSMANNMVVATLHGYEKFGNSIFFETQGARLSANKENAIVLSVGKKFLSSNFFETRDGLYLLINANGSCAINHCKAEDKLCLDVFRGLPGNHGAGLSHRCLWLGPSIENMRMRL